MDYQQTVFRKVTPDSWPHVVCVSISFLSEAVRPTHVVRESKERPSGRYDVLNSGVSRLVASPFSHLPSNLQIRAVVGINLL